MIDRILEQCRRHDKHLAPFVVPEADHDTKALYKISIERLRRALQRGRYVLAFDGVETFLWPPTRHHGEFGSKDKLDREAQRLQALLTGLTNIKDLCSCDTIVCMSIDRPRVRRSQECPERDEARLDSENRSRIPIKKVQEALRFYKELKEPPGAPPDPKPQLKPLDPGDTLDEGHLLIMIELDALKGVTFKKGETNKASDKASAALALLLLSCFRRPRHLAALRCLLAKFVKNTEPYADKLSHDKTPPTDVLIDVLTGSKSRYLIPVEGGGFRMMRELRDTIYAAASSHTRTEEIKNWVKTFYDRDGEPIQDSRAVAAAVQSFWLALLHEWIARYYYSENYLMSSDAWVFLEYAYHRASSIRYLTRLHVINGILAPTPARSGRIGLTCCRGRNNGFAIATRRSGSVKSGHSFCGVYSTSWNESGAAFRSARRPPSSRSGARGSCKMILGSTSPSSSMVAASSRQRSTSPPTLL